MTNIQLNVGELWELGGERHYLDQVMGSGFLLFRSERTAAPFQIPLDTGEGASPTVDWLTEQFAIGAVRRLDTMLPKTFAQQVAVAREDDFDAIVGKDPRALVRQIVLKSLDKIKGYARSDQGIRRALAAIWAAKPRQLEGHQPPAPTTVRRWLDERGCFNARMLKTMISMSGRVPRARRLPITVHRRVHRAAMAYWANAAETIGGAHDLLVGRLAKINRWLEANKLALVPLPSEETFRKHVRHTECFDTVAAKYGTKEANQRFKACGTGLVSHRPLLLGAMDHTRADFFVVIDVDGWRMLGRPWLTVLIDVHSRCIVGWVLSFEPPSLYSITECIKRANRPKLQMRAAGPDHSALVWVYGKFDEIVVDNGWEFIGTSFESAMTDIGTSVRWAPVKSPTYKAVVERFFGTLNALLFRKLPGGTFPIAQMRAWELDPRKDAVLTLAEAEALLTSAIAVYHQELHTTLGDTPLNVWTKGVRAQGGVQVIGDDRQLDKMVGAHEERKLTRSGVSLFGLQYHDPAIVGPLLERLAGRQPTRGRRKGSATAKVTVKYNPANLGELHVWNQMTGIFETLPCTEPEYAAGLSKWQHECIQSWEREASDNTAIERCERRLALRRQIEAGSSPKQLARDKAKAVRLLSSPHIEQLAGGHLRLAHAQPRHDGMAPIIPTVPLAPERSDDHQKPVRPARGQKRRKVEKVAPKADPSPASQEWLPVQDDGADWEDFQ